MPLAGFGIKRLWYYWKDKSRKFAAKPAKIVCIYSFSGIAKALEINYSVYTG